MSSLSDTLNRLGGNSSRRHQVDLIYDKNIKILDALITEIKRLNSANKTQEAQKLGRPKNPCVIVPVC